MKIPGFDGDYQPLLAEHEDGRTDIPDVHPLLVDVERTHVVRQLTDLEGCPLSDRDEFERRCAVFGRLVGTVAAAPYTPRYIVGRGGYVATEFIRGGRVLTTALHDLYRRKIDGRSEAGVIRPTNHMIQAVVTNNRDAVAAKGPIVLDILKSNQWMIGPNSRQPKPHLQLVDHDMFVAFPEPSGEYNDVDRLHILRQSLMKAANIGIFLANLSKLPQLRRPGMFQPALDVIDNFMTFTASSQIATDAFERSIIEHMTEVFRGTVQSKQVNNQLPLEMAGIDAVVLDELVRRIDIRDAR